MSETEVKQFRSTILFLLFMACVMFYYAFDIWIQQENVCLERKRFCELSKLIAGLTGVVLYKVTAQIWVAMGLFMLFVTFIMIRARNQANKKINTKVDRMR